MTMYSRSTVALPQNHLLGDVLLWNATGFSTLNGVDRLLTTNSDGTLTRVTGSGFSLGADHVPIAGSVTMIERLAADGVTPLETFTGIAASYSLLNFYFGSFGSFAAAIFAGNDTLTGGGSDDWLSGGFGNDTINAGGGADTINGDGGTNTIDAGGGDDTITSYGMDAIDGGSGLDSAVIYANSRSGTAIMLDFSKPDQALSLGNGFGSLIHVEAVQFFADAGNDRLTASNSVLGLTANTLHGAFGNDRLTAGGNGASLFGEAGNDMLIGGTGADLLSGGAGNDTYVLGTILDTVIESAGQGTDTILSLWHRSLTTAAYAAIENLSLLGVANLNGTGNALANTVIGNAGANVLDGWTGNDALTGGPGKDSFRFDTAMNAASNIDRITDFSVADDTILLKKLGAGLFNALTIGHPLAGAFHATSTGLASEADDRVVYNSLNGQLFYDADGSGAGAAIQFATLSAHLLLTSADFLVV